MPLRMLDLECRKCGAVVRDSFFRNVPRVIVHARVSKGSRCKGVMDQVFLPSARRGSWSDKDAVVVFKKPDGTFSYPGRNDAPTPKGCERVVMKSLREVETFEKQNNVLCEAMHYDSGNGPELRDHIDRREPESVRLARFMEHYRA